MKIFSKKIPKEFIITNERKEMWKEANKLLKKINKVIPISSAYLVGSFYSDKKRPADVDTVLLLKTKKDNDKKWALDLEIVPDNKFGREALNDVEKWSKKRYGKKSGLFKLK